MAAMAAGILGGGVVHGESLTRRKIEPAMYSVSLHPTKGYRSAPKWKKRGKSAKVRRVPIKRSAGKAAARRLEMANHLRIAAEGIPTKYMHSHARSMMAFRKAIEVRSEAVTP